MARAAINLNGPTGEVIDVTSLGRNTISSHKAGVGEYRVQGTLGMCPPPEGWGYVINQMDAGASVATGFADGVLLVSVAKDGKPADLLHSITLHVSVEEMPVPLPPEPVPADPLQQAQEEAARLRAIADAAIAPLQDAVDLDEATEAEALRLKEWKRYRVALNRLPEQEGYPTAIDWPAPPT